MLQIPCIILKIVQCMTIVLEKYITTYCTDCSIKVNPFTGPFEKSTWIFAAF